MEKRSSRPVGRLYFILNIYRIRLIACSASILFFRLLPGFECPGTDPFQILCRKGVFAVAELAAHFQIFPGRFIFPDHAVDFFCPQQDQASFTAVTAAVAAEADILPLRDINIKAVQDQGQHLLGRIAHVQHGRDRSDPGQVLLQAGDRFLFREGHELDNEAAGLFIRTPSPTEEGICSDSA